MAQPSRATFFSRRQGWPNVCRLCRLTLNSGFLSIISLATNLASRPAWTKAAAKKRPASVCCGTFRACFGSYCRVEWLVQTMRARDAPQMIRDAGLPRAYSTGA
jgi:hypothetical protein